MARYRLIDTAGAELSIVELDGTVAEGETVELADFGEVEILEIYDDADGRDGGVDATVVIDVA